MKKLLSLFLSALLVLSLPACSVPDEVIDAGKDVLTGSFSEVDTAFGVDADVLNPVEPDIVLTDYDITIPAWNGSDAYYIVNENQPYFDEFDRSRLDAFEDYAELDHLGRCGTAYANICMELMPTEKRGEIGSVKPSGWHTVRYNGVVSGNYLYNRCHLIGYQLAGENANPKNLITGTRYLNIDGMLDFENMIADYVKETKHHVLYRVTPVYDGDDLVSRGVLMEAWSVEDAGDGVCFNIFAYNNQPGVSIDYATGDSWLSDGREVQDGVPVGDVSAESPDLDSGDVFEFVVNSNSGKFHLEECNCAQSMNESNRVELTDSVGNMLQAGYDPCGVCHPDEVG